MDLGILDVMQIFGRAGRPQFDQQGQGTIITSHDKLGHYLTLLTQQNPIESQFLASLADNLNAEVSPPPPPSAPGPADAVSLAPGGPGLRHQRGGGGEVAELHLPVRAPEGQPSGLRGQPQAPPGRCRRVGASGCAGWTGLCVCVCRWTPRWSSTGRSWWCRRAASWIRPA